MKKNGPLRIPVTRGLKDIYSMDMRAAYQAARSDQFNPVAFSRLAAAVSVVRTALEQKQTKLPLAIETLDTTIETLVAIRNRGDQTGVWEITESEFPLVLDGIDMVEQSIGTLDVALLERTAASLFQFMNTEQDGE